MSPLWTWIDTLPQDVLLLGILILLAFLIALPWRMPR